ALGDRPLPLEPDRLPEEPVGPAVAVEEGAAAGEAVLAQPARQRAAAGAQGAGLGRLGLLAPPDGAPEQRPPEPGRGPGGPGGAGRCGRGPPAQRDGQQDQVLQGGSVLARTSHGGVLPVGRSGCCAIPNLTTRGPSA